MTGIKTTGEKKMMFFSGRAHPELTPAGPTADRGVNLLMSSVSTMLGLPTSHYVAVDMDGLAALIDALEKENDV